MASVAETLVETLALSGITRVYGLPGDSLNGVIDSIRKHENIEWIHVRNEEAATFAAGAEVANWTWPGNKANVDETTSLLADDRIILALNSGSSSLKIGCFQHDGTQEVLALTGSATRIGSHEGTLELRSADGTTFLTQEHVCESQDEALQQMIEGIRDHLPSPPIAIGHHVVQWRFQLAGAPTHYARRTCTA